MTDKGQKVGRALLSNKLIKKLLPEEKLYRIYDTDIKGFVARILPSGKIGYYYEYRNEAGKNKSYYIGRHGDITADQARDTAKDMSADKTKGVDVQAVKVKKRTEAKENLNKTLIGFIESKYEEWAKAHLATGADAVKRIKRNFPNLLNTQIEDLTIWDLEKWRMEQINKGKKPTTINRDLTCLKSAISKAKEWHFVKVHPLIHFKPLETDSNPVTRYLTEDEEKRLLV